MNIIKQFNLSKKAQQTFPTHKNITCVVRKDATNPFNSINIKKIMEVKEEAFFKVYIHDNYITIRETSGKLEDFPIRLDYLDRKAWVEIYLVFEPYIAS